MVSYHLVVVILREALLSEQKSGPNGGCIKQMKVEEIVEIWEGCEAQSPIRCSISFLVVFCLQT